jgi:hypothetical protein
MPIDPQSLASELTADPDGLGYAAPLAAGNLVAVKSLFDATTGPGAAAIATPTVPRDAFLLALTPAYMALAAKDAATQGKWDRILAVLRAADAVTVNPSLLGLAVSDGILTQPQADAAWHRTGSRAEALWGAGASPSIRDLEIATGAPQS